jgi:serine/threonine-protein kinase
VLPCRLGRYTLFDHIGRGGMADIYLASERTALGAARLVCVKEVLTKFVENERFAEMLVAEAKLAARLSHANVVGVEALEREHQSLFIAMEYVEGFDLRELLRRCASERVALPIEFSLLVVTEALRGLDYAHRLRDEAGKPLGIVHRDVSPSNVLVSFEGEVKLCDFGIARANDVAAAGSPAPGLEEAIAGKAGYMSPEQARGEVLDARADVFSTGIVLWELLAGRRLYRAREGESLLEVARRAEVPPLEPRGLHEEHVLHAIVSKALAPDSAERFSSAAAMLRELSAYAASAHLAASPLRFGEWLMENFGRATVAARRGRVRALRAIERGPVALFRPIGEPWDIDLVSPLDAVAVTLRTPPPAPAAPRLALDELDEPLQEKEELPAIEKVAEIEAGGLDAVREAAEELAHDAALEPASRSRATATWWRLVPAVLLVLLAIAYVALR